MILLSISKMAFIPLWWPSTPVLPSLMLSILVSYYFCYFERSKSMSSCVVFVKFPGCFQSLILFYWFCSLRARLLVVAIKFINSLLRTMLQKLLFIHVYSFNIWFSSFVHMLITSTNCNLTASQMDRLVWLCSYLSSTFEYCEVVLPSSLASRNLYFSI